MTHIIFYQNGERKFELLDSNEARDYNILEFDEVCARPGVTKAELYFGNIPDRIYEMGGYIICQKSK